MTMPLKYPAEWKFDGCPYAISSEANSEFVDIACTIAEGSDNPKRVFEDFKSAYGEGGRSSSESWARHDMTRAMADATENAARYLASFYGGMESAIGRDIAVPNVERLNKILAEHEIPLRIEGDKLSKTGDVIFTEAADVEALTEWAFKLGEEIGHGSFGRVHKVTRKTKLGEFDFAMKVLAPSVFIENKERAARRFLRELGMLQALQHRAIVPLLEAGMTPEESPYILMPYIHGADIRSALTGARPETIYEAFAEVALGLAFAHEQGAIHRDLKPSNIMVRKADGQPFILDFGCAYMIDLMDETLTTQMLGTPGYMAPEIQDDPKHRDQRQDLYALGVMLYEVITSSRPKFHKYIPVAKGHPQFNGVDELIQGLIAPEEDRIGHAGQVCEFLAAL